MSLRLSSIGLALGLLLLPPLVAADEVPILKTVSRRILTLYKLDPPKNDEEEEQDIVDTPAHLHAEVVLNHLGMELVHRSIEEDLPSEKEMEGFRGILTWFTRDDAIPDPNVYCPWAKRQIESGKKLVILDEPGFITDHGNTISDSCQELLKTLGATYLENYSDNPFYFRIAEKDPTMVEFERKLLLVEGHTYSQFKTLSPSAKVYLKMVRRDQEGSESDMVFTTMHGGFVHPTYVNYAIKEMEKIQWRIHPFRFFEEAFGVKGLPRPDATTLNGRRIFFSHIDGDGILNESHIDNESYSGEIILEEILKKYPTIPITTSLITGYLDMREYRHERIMKMYRSILELPNTEPAAHGHSHPLIWKKKKLAVKVPGYRYSDQAEIAGSVQKMNSLLEELGIKRRAALFSWTGDCRPTEEQLAIPYQSGLLNMNGGDSRLDKRFDSYSFVFPLSFLRGDYRQVYAAASNENTYTNLWKGPYYGYEEVVETFRNTETPVRIKPINVYYHYYSGEVVAGLGAVKKAYDHALSQEIFPIFASEYVPIVHDFFDTRMTPLPGGGWQILNDGSLRTIRFDDEAKNVDLGRSTGVVGFRHFQGSLYVFLDDHKSHDIHLTGSAPSRPYVISASFQIKNFEGTAMRLRFEKRGWHRSEIVLGGMAPDKEYWIHVGRESLTFRSEKGGELKVQFPKGENGGAFVPVWIASQFY